MGNSFCAASHAIVRILAAPIIYGIVACSGSSSAPPPPAPPPPVSTLASVTIKIEDPLPRSLADVRVEITSGDDAGQFMMTPANGRVTIQGHTLTGTLSLHISKPGYSSADVSLPSSSGLNLITLVPDVLLDLTGEHQLTVEADSECELPEIARTRTYKATFRSGTNSPWYFNIDLSEASFFEDLYQFGTYVNADALRYEIYLRGFLEEDPMVEQLSATEYFAFIGEAFAEANQADTVITAQFDGQIQYCTATPTTTYPECVTTVYCASESHKVILTRQ